MGSRQSESAQIQRSEKFDRAREHIGKARIQASYALNGETPVAQNAGRKSLFQEQKKIVAYCTKAVLKYVAGFLRSKTHKRASWRVAGFRRPARGKATEEFLEENNQCGAYEMCS